MPDIRVLLEDAEGKCVLLLGNEAIARGALEAGIGVVTTYPGTPASEIGDSISAIAKNAGMYMEYSTNEIVALETAAGAAICGVRALSVMKHVGLNVAADALMTLAYVGVRGGMVIVTADDPECYSSQNEQDNRYYALLSKLPFLEPSNAQEAKDMVPYAVKMSEQQQLPVLLRTTTRISHTRGPVTFGALEKANLKGEFVKDVKRFVMVPAHARTQHKVLLEKVERAKKISETSPFNRIVRQGKTIGIISSGAAYNYVAEAVEFLDLDAGILKLGMTHPLPEQKIIKFLKSHDKIVVVEELAPYLELHIKAMAKDQSPNVAIYGKMKTSFFPYFGELSTRIVVEALAKITGKEPLINFKAIDEKYSQAREILLPRPPILCPGCPHRASFHIIKTVTAGKAVVSTDIGCYALGIQPPLQVGDVLICMGASIGTAGGISKVAGLDAVAVVGDSTFFHAAIPGLANAVYNNHKVTLAVLDNLTTAMTGQQPHPGTGKTGMQTETNRILIEDVARGLGVKYVKVVNPFKVREATEIFKEALKTSGPSVVVFRAPCTLLVLRERRKKGIKVAPMKITDECNNCMVCVKLTGCPALVVKEDRVTVDGTLCTACTLCMSVCPYNAIQGGTV
ncbi:indolepyruvate ferredoxin oxidoreductase subunit alpha [Candidatus Bathyarchaeota archaeon]|nr:indolepyruvate ferredoxin oxidoreductase subunit alpha [Candidatus Bathyarchaeota archaeon]